jgi:tryptophan synthase alpha chain
VNQPAAHSSLTTAPTLEATLRAARDDGRKTLLPYITGGYDAGWVDYLRAAADAGADAIEVGIPFSDPVMDGTTIQIASDRSLKRGTTPQSVLADVRNADIGVPLIAMTYVNIAYHAGYERFAHWLRDAGVCAAILPDLPLEEVGPWAEVADRVGIETVLLAAPTAPDERLPRVCERARGFVYGVGLLGVTGVREQLAASAAVMAQRLKVVTDKPVIVGVGISTPEQAVEVCHHADGVVVGSAVVQRMIDGAGPEGVGALVREFRVALDRAHGSTPVVADAATS